ncbi:MAG: hypothetical protein KF819_22680 [Labilithrix sp.]|nr:hypothetical protein [Labilithrix sp.]
MRLARSLFLTAVLSVAAAAPLACGKAPEVPGVTLDAGFAFGMGEGGAPAPITEPPPDAEADAAPAAPDAAAPVGSAPAVLVGAIDQAIDVAIAAAAAKEAPGMTAEGQPGRETLTENGHFNMMFTMQPGRCYTVIAMSAPAMVSQLEVKLLAPPFFNVEAGRSAATDKNPAVLGRGKAAQCPILPVAVPYKLDVTAKKGGGRIAVQVFSRSK